MDIHKFLEVFMVELEVLNDVFYNVNLLSPVQGVLHNNLDPPVVCKRS